MEKKIMLNFNEVEVAGGAVLGAGIIAGTILFVKYCKKCYKKSKDDYDKYLKDLAVAREEALMEISKYDYAKLTLQNSKLESWEAAILYKRLSDLKWEIKESREVKDIERYKTKFIERVLVISGDDCVGAKNLAKYYKEVEDAETKEKELLAAKKERQEKMAMELEKYKTIAKTVKGVAESIGPKKSDVIINNK